MLSELFVYVYAHIVLVLEASTDAPASQLSAPLIVAGGRSRRFFPLTWIGARDHPQILPTGKLRPTFFSFLLCYTVYTCT